MIIIMSEELVHHLISITGRSKQLDQGVQLFNQGDQVESVFIVKTGMVELVRNQVDGYSTVLHRYRDNTVLAEASIYSETYHCDAIVSRPTELYVISKSSFLTETGKNTSIAKMWAAHLAREVQNARFRSEILTRKTVASRLDGWLASYGSSLPEKGQWKDIAVQIGVTPEALYRELAKRRKN